MRLTSGSRLVMRPEGCAEWEDGPALWHASWVDAVSSAIRFSLWRLDCEIGVMNDDGEVLVIPEDVKRFCIAAAQIAFGRSAGKTTWEVACSRLLSSPRSAFEDTACEVVNEAFGKDGLARELERRKAELPETNRREAGARAMFTAGRELMDIGLFAEALPVLMDAVTSCDDLFFHSFCWQTMARCACEADDWQVCEKALGMAGALDGSYRSSEPARLLQDAITAHAK